MDASSFKKMQTKSEGDRSQPIDAAVNAQCVNGIFNAEVFKKAGFFRKGWYNKKAGFFRKGMCNGTSTERPVSSGKVCVTGRLQKGRFLPERLV